MRPEKRIRGLVVEYLPAKNGTHSSIIRVIFGNHCGHTQRNTNRIESTVTRRIYRNLLTANAVRHQHLHDAVRRRPEFNSRRMHLLLSRSTSRGRRREDSTTIDGIFIHSTTIASIFIAWDDDILLLCTSFRTLRSYSTKSVTESRRRPRTIYIAPARVFLVASVSFARKTLARARRPSSIARARVRLSVATNARGKRQKISRRHSFSFA